MSSNSDVQITIRHYLLGQLDGDAREVFEKRLLTDDDLFDELLAIEDELIDEYLVGAMGEDERASFEKKFLMTPERHQKMRFARALRKYSTTHPLEEPSQIGKPTRKLSNWPQLFSNPYVRSVAFASLLLIAAFGVWRIFFFQSDVNKGLIALNAAYRDQRPVEARITQLDYAPYVTTRGNGPDHVNTLELDRAERILLDAVRDNSSAASHHALGNVYLAKKELEKAIEQFEAALKRDPGKAQIYADLGAAWLEKGKISLDKGRVNATGSESGKGMEELGRSLDNLKKALDLDNTLLDALFNKALAEQYMMLYSQAEQDWREYLKRDSTSRWAEEVGRYLKFLEERKATTSGTKEQLIGDFQRAFESQNDDAGWAAISLSRARTGNAIVEVLLDDYLALSLSGRTLDANEKLQRISYAGRLEQERAGDRFTSDIARFYGATSANERGFLVRARAQMKVANEHFNKGEFDQAIDLYSHAKNSFASKGDIPETLFAESWIGYSRLRIPQTNESTELFGKLAGEFESYNYRSLLAQSLHALADASSSLNEFSRALDYANRGEKVAEEIEDHATTIRCLGLAVSMQLTLGHYRDSLGSLDRALSLASTISPEPRLTWPLYYEAALDFHFLGLPASALAFEQEALWLAETSGVPLLRSRAWGRLAVIYGQQKKYDEAIECAMKALGEAQKISSELSRKNVSAHSMLVLGQLHREAGRWREAVDYFDRSLALYKDLNFDAYSYQAHKGKLLALIALNENASADNELRIVLTLFEEQRKKIAEQSYRDSFFDVGQETYDIAVDFAYSRRDGENQAFAYAEASRARSLVEMMATGTQATQGYRGLDLKIASETTALSLSEIQRLMSPQVQLLEYVVLDDKVVIWVITNSSVRSALSEIRASELEQGIRLYVKLLSGGGTYDREAMLKVARELHRALIAPIERFLNNDLQLCIVADKSLNYLPFGALVSESSGRYLIEDFQLQVAPSATVFVQCSEEAKKREKVSSERLLVVGNPRFDHSQFPSLPDLPDASREAEQIALFFPLATKLIEDKASKDLVTRAIKSADVIHLATHAVADERSPLLSKFLLASQREGPQATTTETDGVLQAWEIYQLQFPRTRLVVLSACQTGIERAYRGEGAVGLARPFLSGGVPLVVASLWPVDSEATAEFMVKFHRFRKEDKLRTTEALQRAQLEMIRNPPLDSKSHNGWAAFAVVGGYATF